jgi:hypothetical protein
VTPAEKAVIDAAMIWADNRNVFEAGQILVDACDALTEAREAAPAESMRPWSEIVTEDEIYSTKTGKWYRVLETAQLDDGQIRVRLDRMWQQFTNPATAEVRCRRGESGQAVDVFIDVFRSGPS